MCFGISLSWEDITSGVTLCSKKYKYTDLLETDIYIITKVINDTLWEGFDHKSIFPRVAKGEKHQGSQYSFMKFLI